MNGAALKRLRAEALLRDCSEGLHEEFDTDATIGCDYPGCRDAYFLLAELEPAGWVR